MSEFWIGMVLSHKGKTLFHGHSLYLSSSQRSEKLTVRRSMVEPRTTSTNLERSMLFVSKISDQILDLSIKTILCKHNYQQVEASILQGQAIYELQVDYLVEYHSPKGAGEVWYGYWLRFLVTSCCTLFSTMFCSIFFIKNLHEDKEGILIKAADNEKPRELTNSWITMSYSATPLPFTNTMSKFNKIQFSCGKCPICYLN